MKPLKSIPIKSIIKEAEKLKQPTIVLMSRINGKLDIFISNYIQLGFRIYKQGSKRKYLFFGEKKYFVILVADKGYYEKSLEVAVKLEHYEKAAEFKRKLDEFL